MRPIGNVCYDLQKRSVVYCDRSYDWWYVIVRLVVRVVARSTTIGEDRLARSTVGNSTTSGSHNRSIVRLIVASCDRSYDHSWHPTIDRTINRGILRRPPIVGLHHSCHPTIDRTINRGIMRPTVYQSWHPTIDRTINRRDR